GCDLARAVLVAVMVVPGVPLPASVALLAAVTSLASPFEAARSSLLPDILDEDRYTVGLAVVQTTFRSAMVLGYAAGGIAWRRSDRARRWRLTRALSRRRRPWCATGSGPVLPLPAAALPRALARGLPPGAGRRR